MYKVKTTEIQYINTATVLGFALYHGSKLYAAFHRDDKKNLNLQWRKIIKNKKLQNRKR